MLRVIRQLAISDAGAALDLFIKETDADGNISHIPLDEKAVKDDSDLIKCGNCHE